MATLLKKETIGPTIALKLSLEEANTLLAITEHKLVAELPDYTRNHIESIHKAILEVVV